jgi:hypothetical protein
VIFLHPPNFGPQFATQQHRLKRNVVLPRRSAGEIGGPTEGGLRYEFMKGGSFVSLTGKVSKEIGRLTFAGLPGRRVVMKYRRLFLLCAPMITLLFLLVVGYPTSVATAQTIYGTLDNFDVINDTGGETHGFEIELEGITSSDVAYTFGTPSGS